MPHTDGTSITLSGPIAEQRPTSLVRRRRPAKRVVVKKKSPTERSTAESRARLSFVLLLYFVGIVSVVTLAPFEFYRPRTFDVALARADWRDVVTGALLFVPLGFLFPLTRAERDTSVFRVTVFGLALGGVLEALQLFEVSRVPSAIEALATGIGAGIGAALLMAVNGRIRKSPRLSGRLSLEIPLMGLIYLLIPLVIATSMSTVDDPLHAISLLPLVLLGARLISAVQEHHFGPGGVFRKRSIAAVGFGWATLGVFPVILREPIVGVGLAVLVALATAHESMIPSVRGGMKERRFESDVIRSAMPYIAVYFLTATFLPIALGMADWRAAFLPAGDVATVARQIIGALEPLAALAVLGYVLAEARGRRELPFRKVIVRIAIECTTVALVMEGIRGFQRDGGASGARAAAMIAASVVGAAIYHKQRERIRWILVHRAPAPERAVLEVGRP